MISERGRLNSKELRQLKWLLGGLLSLLSLWAMWSLNLQAEPLVLFGLTVVFAGLCRPQMIMRLPQRVLRWLGPGLLVVILADFAMTMPRSSEFLPPLVRMVILLLIYRFIAPRRRREDLQLILLCLFCVVLSGVLTVSLLFALQILLFMPVAMGLLFTICLLNNGDDDQTATFDANFSALKLLGRVRVVLDYKFLTVGILLFACMVFVSTVLFVLMPRFNLDQAIPFLQLTGSSRSGFSSDVRLGEVSEIKEDRAIALSIDVPSMEAMVARPYWRMLVLDYYEYGYFRVSDVVRFGSLSTNMEVRSLSGWDRWRVPYTQRDDGVWTFYLEGGVSRYLPLPGPFTSMRFPNLQKIQVSSSLLVMNTDVVKQSVVSYQLENMQWRDRLPASDLEKTTYSNPPEMMADQVSYPLTALSLPLEDADRAYLREVNAELIGENSDISVDAYGQRVIQYLASRHAYSLRPGNGTGASDPVVRWMRSGSSGHCEYFAGAMILLAREAGYPARMAVGFLGGSWNSVESYFVVRNSDAHAWVEIYDPRSGDWIRMDPTPGNGPVNPREPIASQIPIDSGWSAWIDSLRMQWYRRVVNFDQSDQLKLADSAKGIWQRLSEVLKEWKKGASEWLGGLWSGDLRWKYVWMGLPILLIVVLVGLLRSLDWWRLLFFRLLRRQPENDPRRIKASRYLKRIESRRLDALDAGKVPDTSLLRCRERLQAIRFGPEASLSAADAVFAEARQALRR